MISNELFLDTEYKIDCEKKINLYDYIKGQSNPVLNIINKNNERYKEFTIKESSPQFKTQRKITVVSQNSQQNQEN